MDTRARLTIPDVMFLLFSVAILGALFPVFQDLMNKHAASMSTGEAYLLQLVLPLIIVVLFSVVFVTAIAGGQA